MKPDYSHVIATTYRQFEFRSRLEAKWAVFFDLCGWSWSYEPFDMAGWIPDFAIGERPVLVEIKPFFKEADFGDEKKKIMDSGCKQPVILLGADAAWVAAENGSDGGPCIGWLFEPLDIEPNGPLHWESYDLHFGVTEGNCKPGVCTMGMAWTNQIWKAPECSHPNKWSRVWLEGHDIEQHLVERWAQACNVSKWIKTK